LAAEKGFENRRNYKNVLKRMLHLKLAKKTANKKYNMKAVTKEQ
jgi:hypothetical protein